MKTSKAATKRAIKALPALRTSLLWFKRETVRALKLRAQDATSLAIRNVYAEKARKIASSELADLRLAYQAERVNEIRQARRFELSRAVPGILWMEA